MGCVPMKADVQGSVRQVIRKMAKPLNFLQAFKY